MPLLIKSVRKAYILILQQTLPCHIHGKGSVCLPQLGECSVGFKLAIGITLLSPSPSIQDAKSSIAGDDIWYLNPTSCIFQ